MAVDQRRVMRSSRGLVREGGVEELRRFWRREVRLWMGWEEVMGGKGGGGGRARPGEVVCVLL